VKTLFPRSLTLLVFVVALFLPAQTPKPVPYADRSNLLDINSATTEQLLALPGMGRAYVQRIIAGRPYTAKNQLLTRGILPEPAYEKIAGLIVARRVTAH